MLFYYFSISCTAVFFFLQSIQYIRLFPCLCLPISTSPCLPIGHYGLW